MHKVRFRDLTVTAGAVVAILKDNKFVGGPSAQVEDIGEPLLVFRGLLGKCLERSKVVYLSVGVGEEGPAGGDLRVPGSPSEGFDFVLEVLP